MVFDVSKKPSNASWSIMWCRNPLLLRMNVSIAAAALAVNQSECGASPTLPDRDWKNLRPSESVNVLSAISVIVLPVMSRYPRLVKPVK